MTGYSYNAGSSRATANFVCGIASGELPTPQADLSREGHSAFVGSEASYAL